MGGKYRYVVIHSISTSNHNVKGKVDFPQIGFEKGTTERGVSKVSKSC